MHWANPLPERVLARILMQLMRVLRHTQSAKHPRLQIHDTLTLLPGANQMA